MRLFGVIFLIKDKTQTQNLTIEKLPEGGLRKCTKFGQAELNDERKTFVDFVFYMGFSDLIWATSSAKIINVTRKQK